jgi:hypothetical protein
VESPRGGFSDLGGRSCCLEVTFGEGMGGDEVGDVDDASASAGFSAAIASAAGRRQEVARIVPDEVCNRSDDGNPRSHCRSGLDRSWPLILAGRQ